MIKLVKRRIKRIKGVKRKGSKEGELKESIPGKKRKREIYSKERKRMNKSKRSQENAKDARLKDGKQMTLVSSRIIDDFSHFSHFITLQTVTAAKRVDGDFTIQ